ncbi:MAG: esterase family protein [Bacteroidales bacterium]|nr:esterase family protein [Bacteroidales bacterium]
MKVCRFLCSAVVFLLAVSCSTARFAAGPESHAIESIEGCDGIVEVVSYPSSEPRLSERRMVVYLPPEYYADSLRSYPVLYLLHGARGNEVSWIERGDAFRLLDSLRERDLAEDFILVLPNTNNYYSDKDYMNGHALPAFRAFWLVSGETERYFMQDVVERVDSLYRTVEDKSARAIAGMSSGGLQALHLSANSPGCFDYVALFSPYTKPTFAAWGHRDVYGRLWPKLERQFETPPAKYNIYIGKKDFFIHHISHFDRRMSRRGFDHNLIVTEGGHRWSNWRSYLADFYTSVFK